MTDDVRAIKSPWQTRLGTTGLVVQGDDALDQFIRVALGAQLDSVPNMQDFGIDWLSIIDLPVEDAIPLLMQGAHRVFRMWIEPRAALNRIEPIQESGHLTARVYYTPAGSDEQRTAEVSP